MATKVGDVFAELRLRADKAEADIKKFKAELKETKKGLDDGEKKTKKFGMALKRAGKAAKEAGGQIARGVAVGTAAVTAAGLAAFTFAKSWAKSVDEIGKASSKFKIPAQELQSLQHAADLSDASVGSLRKGIQNLNRFIEDGQEKGVTPFTEALFQLGLSLDDLEGKTKTQQFGIIADELNKIEDQGKQAALQLKLFGTRAGPELGNFIEQGSKGINKMVAEVEALGGTLDKNALQTAANFNDELARMRVVMSGIANFIGVRLAPVIQRIVRRFRDWLLANRDIIATKLERFLVASADAAARLLPKFADLAASALKIVEAVGGIEGALKLAIGGLAAFKLAFIGAFGPAGPIAAAILGLLTLFTVLDSKLDQSARKVDSLVEKSLTTRDVLASGEFSEQELQATEQGREILRLRAEKQALIKQQEGAEKIGTRTREGIQETRRDPGTADEFASFDQEREIDRLEMDRKAAEERAKKILEIQKSIDKRTDDLRTSRLRASRDAQRAGERQRVEDEAMRSEFRKLAEAAVQGSATPEQLERLKQLEGALGIKRPTPTKSFLSDTGTEAGAARAEEPKTPRQLIQEALGGGGTLGVGGLTPSGPGTTINHNNFSINLAAPDIDIVVKGLPQNANAMDVARRVKEEMQNAVQDAVRISYQTQVQQVIG